MNHKTGINDNDVIISHFNTSNMQWEIINEIKNLDKE